MNKSYCTYIQFVNIYPTFYQVMSIKVIEKFFTVAIIGNKFDSQQVILGSELLQGSWGIGGKHSTIPTKSSREILWESYYVFRQHF